MSSVTDQFSLPSPLHLVCYLTEMFHLVEFQSNKAVAVVPENWCCDGATYWPNYRNDERVDKAVKNVEEPGPDWKTYDIRIIKSCDQYFEARQLLKKSLTCSTSDLQSEEEEEEIRPKRKPKAIHFFGDSDSDTEEVYLKRKARAAVRRPLQPPAPVIQPPPFTGASIHTIASSAKTPSPPLLAQMENRPRDEPTPSSSHVYRPTWKGGRYGSDTITCSAAEVQILSLLEYIKHQQDQLTTKVNYLTNKLNSTVQEREIPDPVQFPLQSMEEVENFEKWLKDPANSHLKQSVISSLAAIGGHDPRSITWNILSRMFHSDIGQKINWTGANGKGGFSQMTSKTVLLDAVRKTHVSRAATEEEIRKHAIRWFNLAADRGRRRRPPVTIPNQC
ncbi:uncharacterized protein LOC115784866 isoform X5 [Archocentrus centrarchus]|uniref:uncharacterized protein LOC115784866 isoform X5 n=1 Tax=Archocentrus centrarchus TaxID=63155 RepID=UPI0011E9D9F7|nr:uncharacterized protein LOC115784866 isoform X5 [Archocentrus centrarchus]